MSELIGYLMYTNRESILGKTKDVKQEFWCTACTIPYCGNNPPSETHTPVYKISIGIYSQVCDLCKKIVIDGVKKGDGKPLCLFGKSS